MALDGTERDHKPTPEALAELTGRPAEEFEADDIPLPDPDDLDVHDADEFYSDEE